jgi:hypothetical protein
MLILKCWPMSKKGYWKRETFIEINIAPKGYANEP